MNPSKFTFFFEFADDIVRAEMRAVIKDQRELIKKKVGDKAVLDAAKVLLRYYS